MKFEFKIPPWAHQLQEFEQTKDFEAWALLWQMRTGKTKVMIDTAMHLFIENKIDAVLIVTRSGVHSNWIRKEIPKHCSIPYDAGWWDSDKVKKPAYQHRLHEISLCESLIFFAVNNEALIRPKAQEYIRKLLRSMRVMLIVDEVHDFRTYNSNRSEVIHKLARHCPYRRILTGTNNGNSPLGNWSQFEILQEGALGFKEYKDFKKRHADVEWDRSKSGKMYEVISGYKNLADMRKAISRWSSTISRKDCPDLPPLIVSTVDVKISPAQRTAYRALKKQFELALLAGVVVTAEEAAKRRLKLQQILSNFIIDDQGETHAIDEKANKRAEVLLEQIEDVDGKVIVWCQFKQDIKNVAWRLKMYKIKFVEYHGSVAKKDKFVAEQIFRDDPECKVFLAHPKSAGQGFDLSSANTIIWYSHVDDVILRDQANERATEKGSGSSVAVIDLAVPGSVDDDILENQKAKKEISNYMTNTRIDWKAAMLASLEKDEI